MKRGLPFLILVVLALAGCDNPQRSVDSLRKEITEYKAAPDDQKEVAIEKSFAKLDEQVEAVRKKGETIKARELAAEADDLRGEFKSAKMARALQDTQKALKGLGDALKNTGKDLREVFTGTGSDDKK